MGRLRICLFYVCDVRMKRKRHSYYMTAEQGWFPFLSKSKGETVFSIRYRRSNQGTVRFSRHSSNTGCITLLYDTLSGCITRLPSAKTSSTGKAQKDGKRTFFYEQKNSNAVGGQRSRPAARCIRTASSNQYNQAYKKRCFAKPSIARRGREPPKGFSGPGRALLKNYSPRSKGTKSCSSVLP